MKHSDASIGPGLRRLSLVRTRRKTIRLKEVKTGFKEEKSQQKNLKSLPSLNYSKQSLISWDDPYDQKDIKKHWEENERK